MKPFTSYGHAILDLGEKTNSDKNDMPRSESLWRWNSLLEKLATSFKAPFQSDWEKKTGLEWREWSRFGDSG